MNLVLVVACLHEANDMRMPVWQSDLFVDAVLQNGDEVEYLCFHYEGKVFKKIKKHLTAYQIAEYCTTKEKKVEYIIRDY